MFAVPRAHARVKTRINAYTIAVPASQRDDRTALACGTFRALLPRSMSLYEWVLALRRAIVAPVDAAVAQKQEMTPLF
jgi:hypothetical protein